MRDKNQVILFLKSLERHWMDITGAKHEKACLAIFFLLVCAQLFSCSKSVELDFNAQLKKDVAAIDLYLSDNKITAIRDSSGVRYVIDSLGAGAKPMPTGTISIKYAASILNTTTLFSKSDGAVVPMVKLITGWQIIVPKIPKGSKFRLYIPSGLAYGSGGGIVPPNSNVFFDVELLDDDAQLITDVATIDAYLDSIGAVNVHKDPSGLRFVYSGDPGTGAVPTSNSNVTVTYTGKFLSTKQVFDNAPSPVFFSLSDVILGWQIGLELIPTGSQVTFYIPSGLGYGPVNRDTPTGSIPPNSNLIFDIHLIATN